jgi:hypothetical protein
MRGRDEMDGARMGEGAGAKESMEPSGDEAT